MAALEVEIITEVDHLVVEAVIIIEVDHLVVEITTEVDLLVGDITEAALMEVVIDYFNNYYCYLIFFNLIYSAGSETLSILTQIS